MLLVMMIRMGLSDVVVVVMVLVLMMDTIAGAIGTPSFALCPGGGVFAAAGVQLVVLVMVKVLLKVVGVGRMNAIGGCEFVGRIRVHCGGLHDEAPARTRSASTHQVDC